MASSFKNLLKILPINGSFAAKHGLKYPRPPIPINHRCPLPLAAATPSLFSQISSFYPFLLLCIRISLSTYFRKQGPAFKHLDNFSSVISYRPPIFLNCFLCFPGIPAFMSFWQPKDLDSFTDLHIANNNK